MTRHTAVFLEREYNRTNHKLNVLTTLKSAIIKDRGMQITHLNYLDGRICTFGGKLTKLDKRIN